MKTIYVKFWSPEEVGLPDSELTEKDIKKYCFKAFKCSNEAHALEVYANTMCTYSTLLDDDADVEGFIDEACKHWMNHDGDWLECNFT